ncbi:MAG: hypothetical protein EON58_05885 [Alphaproteobacteria bacterium]|nr:MAG: hypothetical protein EON58_05885 [Alphaproteobacteria bacterium]
MKRYAITLSALLAVATLSACDRRSESQRSLDNLQERYEADRREIMLNAIGEMERRESTGGAGRDADRKAALREKARTNPEGADAETIAKMPRNEVIATAINSAGFLCAKVRDAYPVSGGIVVHCAEYRSGNGRVKYRIDTAAMEVSKIE